MADMKRAEECRGAVLGYLYARPTVAQTVETIATRLRITEWDFSTDEVRGACVFLCGLDLLKSIRGQLGGSTLHYQITSKGTIEHEGSQAQ